MIFTSININQFMVFLIEIVFGKVVGIFAAIRCCFFRSDFGVQVKVHIYRCAFCNFFCRRAHSIKPATESTFF